MKRTASVSLILVCALIIGAASAAPASAAFKARYKGMTSGDGRVGLSVTKNDQGKRRVTFAVRFEIGCEDGSTQDPRGGVLIHSVKVASDGTFSFHYQAAPGDPVNSLWVDMTGDLAFRHAEGTFEYRYAALTDDGQAQLCGSGALTWTAERKEAGAGTGMPIGDDVLTFR